MKNNKENHNFKKKYGQNFLEDENLFSKIEEVVNLLPNENVLEIGPGLGYLTEMFLKKNINTTCVEIDDDLIPKLSKKFSKYENFNLIHNDFLKLDLNNILKGKTYKVIANIPYYITSPIIEKLIEFKENIDEIFLMVQKEVGERLCSKENDKNRSIFTHFVQFYGETNYLFTVKKELFTPMPKVDSAFIKIKIYKDNKYKNLINEDKYFKFIKTSFSNKRKCLTNNLKSLGYNKDFLEEKLEKINLSKTVRAEDLSIENFIDLIKEIENE